jgi:hypothetical protein
VETVVSLAALLVSIVGWPIAYKLGVRAQRDSLALSLLNEARSAVYQACRDYMAWCGEMARAVNYLRVGWWLTKAEPPLVVTKPWEEARQRLGDLLTLDHRAMRVFEALEDYELLLPWSRSIRLELLQRSRSVTEGFTAQSHRLWFPDQVDDAVATLEAQVGAVFDLQALIFDLGVHVQNRCLGELVKRQIPQRGGLGVEGPRLVDDGQGGLRIAERRSEP